MELATVILRLFLASVFIVAALSKLADLSGTRKAITEFGLPYGLSKIASIALPIFELAVGLMLLIAATAWYGALSAAVLLAVFTIAIIVQLAKGNAPDCHCFGQISTEKIGISSVFRNLIFLIPAILLFSRGYQGQGKELTDLSQNEVTLILIFSIVFLLGVAIDLLRKILLKQVDIDRKIELSAMGSLDVAEVERENAGSPHDGLPIGARLPLHELTDTDNSIVMTNNLANDGRGALLLFVSPNCSPCRAMVPKFREWTESITKSTNLYLISSGSPNENIQKFGDMPLTPLLLQDGRAFANEAGAKWTPSAMYINAEGRVASHIAAGDTAISQLIDDLISTDLSDEFAHFTSTNGNGGHSGVSIGDKLPELSLVSMDGRKINSEVFVGAETLIAFWSLTCPHCVSMGADLKAWERRTDGDKAKLLVFCDGDETAIRELGLNSPIILDPGYEQSEKLGMFGTPSAILVNKDGRFSSETAVGASNIWALVGGK